MDIRGVRPPANRRPRGDGFIDQVAGDISGTYDPQKMYSVEARNTISARNFEQRVVGYEQGSLGTHRRPHKCEGGELVRR